MKKILFLLSYLAILSFITGIIVYNVVTPIPIGKKVVEIKYGTPVPKIAEILEKEGIINSKYLFLVLHAFLRGKLEAGEYEFKGKLSLYEVYKILEEGKARLYKVVVKEGDDLFDIAKNLEKNKICKAEDFLRYAFSEKVVKKYNLDVPSMEGFLFPDTYYFSKNTHPLKVIDVMYKNFLKKTEDLRKHLEEKNLSLEVWVTVASMVEKETFLKEEKHLIAAVIYNRLRRGMKLKIDPTVIYVAKRRGLWRGRLLKKFFYIDDPYNTYVYFGLQPGPISNPGLDSLKASLFPAKVDYLYFVADRYGRKHYFARTYVEHLRNMRRAGR